MRHCRAFWVTGLCNTAWTLGSVPLEWQIGVTNPNRILSLPGLHQGAREESLTDGPTSDDHEDEYGFPPGVLLMCFMDPEKAFNLLPEVSYGEVLQVSGKWDWV